MGENSKIEWCTHTLNLWTGCTVAQYQNGTPRPECEHCYAEAMSKRNTKAFGQWGDDHPRKVTSLHNWAAAYKWNRQAVAQGARPRVFVNSMSDFFDTADAQLSRVRGDAFSLFWKCPQLDFLLLTKRARHADAILTEHLRFDEIQRLSLPPNLWLGITAGTQQALDEGWPLLRELGEKFRFDRIFLSMEPLLEDVRLPEEVALHLDWVIDGGESGHHARPTNPDWFRSLRAQCEDFDIPYFHKQNGEWVGVDQLDWIMNPGETYADKGWPAPREHVFPDGTIVVRLGKEKAGRLLDGREWNQAPASAA